MNIKKELSEIIKKALINLNVEDKEIIIEIPKEKNKGDYSTNIAMQLSKKMAKRPIVIAEEIVEKIDNKDIINNIKIETPGFINFFINKNCFHGIVKEIISAGDNYGKSNIGKNEKINIEFASVNPTGVLHLGHARGSAYGDNLSRILSFVGYNVTKEYYINDGGNQINILGKSIKERYRDLCGIESKMPEKGYFGQEIIDIANDIYINLSDKSLNKDIDYFKNIGVEKLINRIKKDLQTFRVTFDVWSSEKEIRQRGRIEETLKKLDELNVTYKKEGALWLKSSDYNDEKDRVLIKKDGEYTYLTPDIAYHLDKFDRGYLKLIDVLGADHHGYIPRLKASIEALGYDPKKLEIKITQMVRLLKGKEEIKMSKRTGNVVTITDLLDEVGIDAARYFFAMRNIDTQMDFDIDLATKKSSDNPFYYVGYAHARICSILRVVKEEKEYNDFETIESDYAYNILAKLQEFEEVIITSAKKRTPHLIANYAYDLANLFHVYYAHEKILTEKEKHVGERIMLIRAVNIVIKNALKLIGVEAPTKM